MPEGLLPVGKIVSPHGIKGGLKVYPLTDFPEQRFAKGKRLYLEDRAELEIKDARPAKNVYLIHLKGIDDRNAAENLKNHLLCVEISDKLSLPEDTFLVDDIIGCEVKDEYGKNVGLVVEVLQGKANDVYVIDSGKKRIMLPAVKQAILNIDLSNKKLEAKKEYLYEPG